VAGVLNISNNVKHINFGEANRAFYSISLSPEHPTKNLDKPVSLTGLILHSKAQGNSDVDS
jgi:hypothetical protein